MLSRELGRSRGSYRPARHELTDAHALWHEQSRSEQKEQKDPHCFEVSGWASSVVIGISILEVDRKARQFDFFRPDPPWPALRSLASLPGYTLPEAFVAFPTDPEPRFGRSMSKRRPCPERRHRADGIFFRHSSGVRWARSGNGRCLCGTPSEAKTSGKRGTPADAVICRGPLGVHRRTVGSAIPWPGCVPAEPASVSLSSFQRKAILQS